MSRAAMPWWAYGFLGLAVVLSAIAYPHLPARLATHFGPDLRPNGYLPKPLGLLMPIGLMALFAAVWPIFWRIHPQGFDRGAALPTYRLVGGLIEAFLLLVDAWVLGRNLGVRFASGSVLLASWGLLIAVLSNFLPKMPPNWWVGVRTPWTLGDPGVWWRTQRVAGEAGVATGMLVAVGAFLLPPGHAGVVLVALVLAWVAFAVAASYVLSTRRGSP